MSKENWSKFYRLDAYPVAYATGKSSLLNNEGPGGLACCILDKIVKYTLNILAFKSTSDIANSKITWQGVYSVKAYTHGTSKR